MPVDTGSTADVTPEGWVLFQRADGGEVYLWCDAPIFAVEVQQEEDTADGQPPATAILTNGDASIFVTEPAIEVIRRISEARTNLDISERRRNLETPGRPPSR